MSDCNTDVIVKKSRKEHTCNHCWQKIPKGSSYTRSSGIWDNEPYSDAQHHECLRAYIDLNKDEDSYDWWPLHDADDFKEHQEMIRSKYSLFL